MSTPEDYQPVVTRLPEALEAEAQERALAQAAKTEAERERALAETDTERLARESK